MPAASFKSRSVYLAGTGPLRRIRPVKRALLIVGRFGRMDTPIAHAVTLLHVVVRATAIE